MTFWLTCLLVQPRPDRIDMRSAYNCRTEWDVQFRRLMDMGSGPHGLFKVLIHPRGCHLRVIPGIVFSPAS